MIRSDGRIRVTHQGTLPRPDDLRTLVRARGSGQDYNSEELAQRLSAAVAEVVRHQMDIGIDSVNDGEQSKTRSATTSPRDLVAWSRLPRSTIRRLPVARSPGLSRVPPAHATGRHEARVPVRRPLTYTGQPLVQADIANLRAAIAGKQDRWNRHICPPSRRARSSTGSRNSYYPDEEAFLYAIADAMHEEYRAIVESGSCCKSTIRTSPTAGRWIRAVDLAEYRRRARCAPKC